MKKISLILLSVLMVVLMTSCSASLGNYQVRIDKYTLTKDASGNDTVIINYKWTNNSQKETAFIYVISDKVLQNGAECEKAMLTDNAAYLGYEAIRSIKPGETIKLQLAYVLQDTKSPITVELKETANTDSKAPKVTRTFKLS